MGEVRRQDEDSERHLIRAAREQAQGDQRPASVSGTPPQSDGVRAREASSETRSAGGAVAPGQPSMPGRLGPVRLIRLLGRGGMGAVYLGQDELLDRPVAVKFLSEASFEWDAVGVRLFIEGARAAAAVQHPGLTTVFQADTHDGIPYLVIDYVDGPGLDQVLAEHGPLRVELALALIRGVAEPVGVLHARGIVHRDLKPSNVMLDADGRVRVTDFGIAQRRPAEQLILQGQEVAGTPAYMAPEVFEGVVSSRTDVYALGIMTYVLLVGRPPFTGRRLADIHAQHRWHELPAAELRSRGVCAAVIEVLRRATHKQAVYRYKTAGHFAQALAEAYPGLAGVGTQSVVRGLLVSRTSVSSSERLGSSDSTYYATISDLAAQRSGVSATGDALVGATVRPTAEETIAVDVPCISCEYNLRGLSRDGRCPECGRGAAASLDRERPIFIDPLDLDRLHWGLRLARFGPFGSPIALPLTLALIMAAWLSPVARTRPGGPFLLASLCLAVSAWLIAGLIITKLPRGDSVARTKPRRDARIAFGLGVPFLGLGLLCIAVALWPAPGWPDRDALLVAFWLVFVALGLAMAGLVYTQTYLREFLGKAINAGLVSRMRWSAVLLRGAWVAMLLAILLPDLRQLPVYTITQVLVASWVFATMLVTVRVLSDCAAVVRAARRANVHGLELFMRGGTVDEA